MVMKIGNESLFDLIGGRPTLDKVHKSFYDKIYKHPWIGQYFQGIQQEIIEAQQSDFMSQAMGGPAMYLGKLPIPAHRHMFISEELFELRTELLKEAFQEAGVSDQNQEHWLKIDQAFKNGIVKKSLSECSLRFNTDDIINLPNPIKNSA
jgi:truncated hemoglobin YjbI